MMKILPNVSSPTKDFLSSVSIALDMIYFVSSKTYLSCFLLSNTNIAEALLMSRGAPNEIVCVEVLRPSQPNGVMSSAVSLPNHTLTGHA